MTALTEDAIEQNLIDLLQQQGYAYFNDADINFSSENPQLEGFDSVVPIVPKSRWVNALL